MTKRVLVIVLIAVVLTAGAVFVLRDDNTPAAPELEEMADALGAQVMLHLKRGYVPGRSPEMSFVAKPHTFIAGDWDMTTLAGGEPSMSTAHPSPWAYTARVPIIFYGPSYVPPKKKVYERADIAGIAPTFAQLLRMDDFEAEGEALPALESPLPKKLPKVIFSVVIDGGGWNALQEHPDSWPQVRRLAQGGTTFVNADIGSAPSITGALHATFGTGDYPVTHGIPGNQLRDDEGANVDAWLEEADGRFLREPTISELWDEENNNKPVIGTVSYEGWHLGMIGKGSLRPGGDRDVAALWDAGLPDEGEEEVRSEGWWINEDYYELPSALQNTDFESLLRYERELDRRDGLPDGTWFGHTLEELRDSVTRPGTPAFARLTGDAVIDTMREYKIGSDGITDMFWVEMKMPDFAGHLWNVTKPEEADVLRETDTQIGRFVDELDRAVGRGNYVVMISADHGQQPLPELVGGWRINTDELERDLAEEFGDVIEKVSPSDIYVDQDAIDDVDLEEIARWMGTYTIGDNVPLERPGADLVPEGRLDETLFAGVFPGEFLNDLEESDIASFGKSDYDEGDFTLRPTGGG